MKLEKYLAEIEETVARIEARKKLEGDDYNKEWFTPYYVGLLTGIWYMSGRDLDINEEEGQHLFKVYNEAHNSI